LPTFYTEDLIEEHNNESAIRRDFIDIVNYAIYPLFFKIWSKYQLFYKICEEQDTDVTNMLYCLLGLENEHLRKPIQNIQKFFRYTGLTLQLPRSAEGLESMVADCFDLKGHVRTAQCVPRKVTIPEDQHLHLGRSCCTIGEDAVMGEWIHDISGRFQIIIGNASADMLHAFLPDQKLFFEMAQLVNFYVNQSLECELVFEFEDQKVDTTRLSGERWAKLGWNTWLFSVDKKIDSTRTVFSVK
jgi:type VI secretion system protein ImpH